MNSKWLSYEDIILLPSYSECRSRSDLSTKIKFGPREFGVPIVPSNMQCTIDNRAARKLRASNQFYVGHRFGENSYECMWEELWNNGEYISQSIGVQARDKFYITRVAQCNAERLEYLTIDVAHGHHILVKEMIQHVKENLPNVFLIAGNIGTPEACIDLQNWGADAVKVGLSCGKACTTYNKTGVGTPMFTAVNEISKVAKVPVIADGQVREIGDVSKAMVAGADMVMIGSMFAALKDSPAADHEDVLVANGRRYKKFFGSASETNKGHDKYIEGSSKWLPEIDQTYLEFIEEVKQGLQSTMSYGGFDKITELHNMRWGTK